MRPLLAASLAALLLAAAAPASAAEPAAAQLARIMMPKATWAQGLDEVGQMMQSRMGAHPGAKLEYPPDFKDKVRGELEQALPYDDLVAMHAKELAAAYTEQELEGLLSFYSGPLGQKTLAANAQVSEKVAQSAQQRIESKMGDMMKRLSTHVKAPAGASPHSASPHGASPHGASPHGASPHGMPPSAEKAPAAPAKKTSPAKTSPAKKPAPAAAKPAVKAEETPKPADAGAAAPAPAPAK
jgi:hypothetical protein